jgi:hypothetical protein
MIAGLDEAEALKIVTTMLAEEAAAIMRLAMADVDLDASIDSLGMDRSWRWNCVWGSRTVTRSNCR